MAYEIGKPAAQPAHPPKAADIEALMAALAAIGKPHTHTTADGAPYAVVPDGYSIVALPTEHLPKRCVSLVKLRDAASFVAWVNTHKVAQTRIYASMDPAQFLCVVDDFLPSNEDGDPLVQVQWRGYRAEFQVPASREWTTWIAVNRKHMGQLVFAEFLQDNLPDVAEPSGGDLLEMALRFEAAQTGHFVASQRLQDGSHNLQWKADNNASGTVKLPEFITLRIPVFENEQPRDMQARLRYRVKDGALAIWFELVRPHKVLEAAFRDTWARIEKETARTPLLGSPE